MSNKITMITISDFVSPILIKFYGYITRPKVYPSYKKALASLKSIDNYENSELVDLIYQKTVIFLKKIPNTLIETNLNLLFALLISGKKEKYKVVDFGGACGASYYIVRKFLNIEPEWLVVETPRMVEKAKTLSDNHLKFTSTFPNDKVDLIYSSGTLQYLERPYDMLKKFVDTSSRYILLARLRLADQDTITVQKSKLSENGVGELPSGFKDKDIYYVNSALKKDRILKILQKKYKIIYEFDSGKDGYCVFCQFSQK